MDPIDLPPVKSFSCTLSKLNISEHLTERSSPGGSKKIRRFKSIYGLNINDIRKGSLILSSIKQAKVPVAKLYPIINEPQETSYINQLNDIDILRLAIFNYTWDANQWTLAPENMVNDNGVHLESLGIIQSKLELKCGEMCPVKICGAINFDEKSDTLGNVDIFIRASHASIKTQFPQDSIKINVSENVDQTHHSTFFFDQSIPPFGSVVRCENIIPLRIKNFKFTILDMGHARAVKILFSYNDTRYGRNNSNKVCYFVQNIPPLAAVPNQKYHIFIINKGSAKTMITFLNAQTDN